MGFHTFASRATVSAVIVSFLFVSKIGFGSDWLQYRGPESAGITTERIITAPSELWRMTVGSGMSSMISCGGRVYVIGHVRGGAGRGVNTLYCLDSATGAVIWKYAYDCRSVQGGFGSTPLDPAGPRATPATDGVSVYSVSLEEIGRASCRERV